MRTTWLHLSDAVFQVPRVSTVYNCKQTTTKKKNKTKGVTKNKGFSKNEQEKGKKLQITYSTISGLGWVFFFQFFFFFLRFFRAEILKILIKRKKERVEAILQALALPCEAQQQSLGSLAPNRD